MSTTAQTVLTDAAYRLGMNGIPDNANEKNRWLSYLKTAQNEILRKRFWWFTTKEYSFPLVSTQDIYSQPSDYRDSIELRIDGEKVSFKPEYTVNDSLDRPRDNFLSTLNYAYYIQGTDIIIIPQASASPTAHSVSSIVVTTATALVTTATEHGLEVDDYVTIAGADVDLFNTTHQILTVPSTTTYTIAITAGTADPSGTITSTQNNAVLKYYYNSAVITALTDTVAIPDLYVDALAAYVFARVAQVDSERGDASDGFEEYRQIVTDMIVENNKRNSWGKSNNAEII